MDLTFGGKWAFYLARFGYVGLTIDSKALSIIKSDETDPRSLPESMLFNIYMASDEASFILQASNGLYVVSNGDGYIASNERTDNPTNFLKEEITIGMHRAEL
jgi:hypothetical protein